VATFTTFSTTTFIAKSFTKDCPQVDLKVVIDSTDVILRKLQASDLDLALIEGLANAPNLVAEAFLPDELTVVCAPGHPSALAGRIDLDSLQREPMLLREPGSGTRECVLKGQLNGKAGEAAQLNHALQKMEAGPPESAYRC